MFFLKTSCIIYSINQNYLYHVLVLQLILIYLPYFCRNQKCHEINWNGKSVLFDRNQYPPKTFIYYWQFLFLLSFHTNPSYFRDFIKNPGCYLLSFLSKVMILVILIYFPCLFEIIYSDNFYWELYESSSMFDFNSSEKFSIYLFVQHSLRLALISCVYFCTSLSYCVSTVVFTIIIVCAKLK